MGSNLECNVILLERALPPCWLCTSAMGQTSNESAGEDREAGGLGSQQDSAAAFFGIRARRRGVLEPAGHGWVCFPCFIRRPAAQVAGAAGVAFHTALHATYPLKGRCRTASLALAPLVGRQWDIGAMPKLPWSDPKRELPSELRWIAEHRHGTAGEAVSLVALVSRCSVGIDDGRGAEGGTGVEKRRLSDPVKNNVNARLNPCRHQRRAFQFGRRCN